jgi:hypothetical protein
MIRVVELNIKFLLSDIKWSLACCWCSYVSGEWEGRDSWKNNNGSWVAVVINWVLIDVKPADKGNTMLVKGEPIRVPSEGSADKAAATEASVAKTIEADVAKGV